MTDKYFVTDESGNKTHVLISTRMYNHLVEQAEMLHDIADFKSALHENDEFIPADMVNRLARGDNPVNVWRKHRQLSAKALAEKAGLTPGYVSMIESGKREPSVKSLKALANALDVDIDDLIWD